MTGDETKPSQPLVTEAIVARTRQLLESIPYLVLATTDGVEVSARQVQPLTVDDDLTVWVGTSPRSRKVAELSRRPTATLVAEDFDRFAYASIVCDVAIVRDELERGRHWIDDLRPFFPDGPDGDDFVLLRISPRRIELLDFAEGITPPPYGLVPAVVSWRDGAWQASAHPRRA